MAFVHGKYANVALAGYDVSMFLNEADAAKTLDTAETSHFGSQSKTYILGGDDGTYSLKGMYDPAVGAIDDISRVVLAAATTQLIIAPAGFGLGKPMKGGTAKITAWETDAPFAGVETISGSFNADGGIYNGNMLVDNTPRTATYTGGAYDHGTTPTAATTKGLVGWAHVDNRLNSGSVTVTIQHSSDNSTWVDLITFTAVATTLVASQELATSATATVNRYLRGKVTIAGTGTVIATVAAARG